MSEATHTPTPWRVIVTDPVRNWREIASGHRSGVVVPNGFDRHSGGETSTHFGVRISEADADLIVRAVNCHADLLAVCRELVAAVENPDLMSGVLIDRAEKIIRQAAPRGDAGAGRRVTG